MITTIPFSGFYESMHSYEIDRAEEMMFQNESGDGNGRLSERFYWLADYRKVHEQYAKDYAEQFALVNEIDLKFESISSPREYNFTTDRIFCEIPRREVRRIWGLVDKGAFAELCRKRFTSRDGFSSFYSPDFKSWGSVDSWDHNELGTLIACYVKGLDFREDDICYEMNNNGDIDRWLVESVPAGKRPELDRLFRIADYLRHREERDKTWYFKATGQSLLALA